jgi:TolB-like protein/tetratricopeptide (TPR) repeat protein
MRRILDAANLISELKRRRVFRVLVGYGIVSFAVLQVVEPITHALHLQEAVLTYTVLALALGFPVAVVLAWAFDIKQGRVERAPPLPTSGPRAVRLGLLLVGIGVLAAAPGVVWYFFVRKPAPPVPAAGSAAAAPSIAVLSFADLSPSKDQEYFSDGIAEEILNALARVKGLKVAGRTSSFSFKGKSQDLRAIGETLGVANLLEGSVRKQGNKVRIAAQLIQARDGFHLWSKTFDGELTDVFDLQERIARGITDELKVVLQGDQQTRLVPVATNDPEAYALYLQSTAVLNHRDYPRMGQAIGWLTQALKLDPRFARGHARLAMIHALGQENLGSSFAEAERHARLASELDPALAEPWAALGLIAAKQRRFVEQRAVLDHALELDGNDPYVNLHHAQALIWTGYTRQGTERLDRTLAIDPVLPTALFWRGQQYLYAGDQDAAERAFERAASLGLSIASLGLAQVAEARGDHAKARTLRATVPTYSAPCLQDPRGSIPILTAVYYGGDAAERAQAEAVIAGCLATKPARISAWVALALLRLGPEPRVLEILSSLPTENDPPVLVNLWGPLGRAARRAPGFAEFARKIGYADLWDRYGPADGCRRVAPRDYACD